MPLVIRPFERRDLPAIRSCIADLQEAERSLDHRLRSGDEIAEDYLEQLRAKCAAQAGTILVAESDGRVTGFAAVQARVPYEELDDPPGEYAWVSDLVVVGSHRRRGIGQALMIAAQAHALAQGAGELRIGVLVANTAARKLYLVLGFRPHFTFVFALGLGALWEICEFAMDSIFGLNMQKSGLVDTMWDLIVDTVGALVIALLGFAYLSRARNVSFLERWVTRFIQANPRFFKDAT